MLSGGGNEDEVSRLATDHGWLDASGQLTAPGDRLLARSCNKAERERYFVFGGLCPPLQSLIHHTHARWKSASGLFQRKANTDDLP